MINNRKEFFNKLTDLFSEPNETELDIISAMFDRHNVTDNNLESLFNDIVEGYQYKTFPAAAVIKKFWINCDKSAIVGTENSLSWVMEQHEKWSAKRIIEIIMNIRASGEMTPKRIDFLHEWDSMIGVYYILKNDAKFEEDHIYRYLEKVKESIVKGEKINYQTVRESLNLDEDKLKNMNFENIFTKNLRKDKI